MCACFALTIVHVLHTEHCLHLDILQNCCFQYLLVLVPLYSILTSVFVLLILCDINI